MGSEQYRPEQVQPASQLHTGHSAKRQTQTLHDPTRTALVQCSVQRSQQHADARACTFVHLQVARTETSEPTKHPEFLNRVFILRLSEPLGAALAPQISLHCNLFALPSADSTAPGT